MSAIKNLAATKYRAFPKGDGQPRAPQRLDVQPGYASLTPREQAIQSRIHELQGKGHSAKFIAGVISQEFKICMLEGVVKQYITGISTCEPLY